MLAIGYQVQVIGEPHVLCNLFQNVDAEAFAALLDVRPTSLSCVAAETQTDAFVLSGRVQSASALEREDRRPTASRSPERHQPF